MSAQHGRAQPLPRVLVVSRHYASDFGTKVGGVFQRLRMLLEAAERSACALDILFFVDQYMIDRVDPRVAQASLREHWNINAEVYLAPRATKKSGAVMQMLRGAVDLREQEDYFRLNGPAQRAAILSRLRPNTTLIVAHRLGIGRAVADAGAHHVPIVMDLDDIEHRSLARQLLRPPYTLARVLRWIDLPALKRGEFDTLRLMTTSLVCSEIDRAYIEDRGVSKVTVIPNGIRFPDEIPDSEERPMTLFFIGAYGYPPNRDAAEYLIRAIFPLVLEKRPGARLMLVGEAIENLPSHAVRPPSVDFLGFVPNLADAYRRATVVCCPILAGGGTRIKIIEAAAAARPVVSTIVGAEGLDFDDETEILRRDTPRSFADACIELLDDPVRNRAIGEAAFEKGRRLYDRKKIVDRLIETLVASASQSA